MNLFENQPEPQKFTPQFGNILENWFPLILLPCTSPDPSNAGQEVTHVSWIYGQEFSGKTSIFAIQKWLRYFPQKRFLLKKKTWTSFSALILQNFSKFIIYLHLSPFWYFFQIFWNTSVHNVLPSWVLTPPPMLW